MFGLLWMHPVAGGHLPYIIEGHSLTGGQFILNADAAAWSVWICCGKLYNSIIIFIFVS